MKKIITACFFAMLFALVLRPFITYTNSSQAPTGATGAPGDLGTCALSGCHTGSPVITTGNFIVLQSQGTNNLNTTGYIPDTTYNLSINVSNINKPRYGFSITALDENNNPAGMFSLISTANTALNTQGGRMYVSHKNASSTAAWVFKWKAPSSDVGPIKFYVAANGANNDNDKTGDQIYTTVYVVSATQGLTREAGNTGIRPVSAEEGGISVFPNPINRNVSLTYRLQDNLPVYAALYSMDGQIKQELLSTRQEAGHYQQSFALLSDLAEGIYMLQVRMGEQVYFKKVLITP